MPHRSRVRKIVQAFDNSENVSSHLAVEFRKLGIVINQHHHGLTILGTVFRPFTPAWGQHVRIDFTPQGDASCQVMIECALPVPWLDFTHENEKTVEMIVDLIREQRPRSAAKSAREAAAAAP